MGGKHLQAGERFGELTTVMRVDMPAKVSGVVHAGWLCRCSCGASVMVFTGNLRTGHTTKCQTCADATRREKLTRHGHTVGGKVSKVYSVWAGMVARCTRPSSHKYPDYGGRGITVCDQWTKFDNFLADMGDVPFSGAQIDRIDNDKGYEPGNCKWSTRKEQGRNKRNNVLLTLNGVTRTLPEWAEITGIGYDALKQRVRSGWTDERALTTPQRRW